MKQLHELTEAARVLGCAAVMLAATAGEALAQQMTPGDTHSQYIAAVDEYVPAPGQFVNTMPAATAADTPASMAQKCTDCLAANQRTIVSLGAYGGYVTFHFDHSIANIAGQRDLYIMGNAFQSAAYTDIVGGSSEPGIVMVSKDVNGNGLPDDPWYELSGSADADSAGKVVYGYEITYTRKELQDVPWTDNQGRTGSVVRNSYHTQEYFPLWLGDQLTFRGTLLPDNAVDISGRGSYWFQYALREGYVDNLPNTDRQANSFDIAWAVDAYRQPVSLDFVDFVRVYSAVNQMCGWIGETSTEVQGAEDLHLEASLKAISDAVAGVETISVRHDGPQVYFSPDGRRLSRQRRGLNIVRRSDGTAVKMITR